MIDVGRAEIAPHGAFLQQTLRTAGLDVSIRFNQDVPDTIVRLVVGHKPWPHDRAVSQQEPQP
jgi:hypothetical protein